MIRADSYSVTQILLIHLSLRIRGAWRLLEPQTGGGLRGSQMSRGGEDKKMSSQLSYLFVCMGLMYSYLELDGEMTQHEGLV